MCQLTPKNKEEIRQHMLEHLKLFGYPEMTNDQIFQHLPGLWKSLESMGLLADSIAKGFNYGHFVNIAINKRNEADFRSEIDRIFNRG